MTITAAAAAVPAYPPSYPSGVVLVSSKRHLAPLVARLRGAGRLKSGRNVTAFDAAHFAALADVPLRAAALAAALAEYRLRLREVTEAEADDLDLGLVASGELACEEFTLTTSPPNSHAGRLLSLLRTPFAARDGAVWPSYMAVHVVGAFSPEDLVGLLTSACGDASKEITGPDAHTPASGVEEEEGAAPVAYIRGVRRFHRVCCPSLTEMPSALAALRRCALLQRCQRARATSGSTAAAPAEQGQVRFTFSELFAGIGMFRSALESVGGRAAFAVEFALPAQITYALNHRCWHDCPPVLQLSNAQPQQEEETAVHGTSARPLLVSDITEIPSTCFPAHDVLTGGFPCQSFAKAGEAAGLHADKGWLFYEVVRVLAATRPAVFLLENVENLTAVEAGQQLAEIHARLRHPTLAATNVDVSPHHHRRAQGGGGCSNTIHGAGTDDTQELAAPLEYAVQHVVVDGAMLTPQTRKRVYFIGIRVASTPLGTANRSSTGYTAAMADVAQVVAAALRNVETAAQQSPYHTVADLLVVPAASDTATSAHLGGAASGEGVGQRVSASAPSSPTALAAADLQLTSAQWDAVRRSRTFRQNPRWRLCDVHGRARTLLGSYRTSYQLYSEFVPYAPTENVAEVTDALLDAAQTTRGPDDDQVRASVPPATQPSPRPPLRFFALRECARLQGIRDSFRLPHDATPPPTTEASATAAFSPAVLRQVPSGAVYKLIGNAVNPQVVACIGASIAAYLERRQPGIGAPRGSATAGMELLRSDPPPAPVVRHD